MTRSTILPATQTLATLSPHTLLLELPTFRRVELDAALVGKRDSKPAQIAAHELCHWYDIVGTVWGQSYLDLLFVAYDSVLHANDISAYADVLRLFDMDRAILYPSYYKFVDPRAQPKKGPREWRMQLSTGMKVRPDGVGDESDPFLFVRFADAGGQVARQPITVGTLLELRSIYAETATFSELLNYEKGEDQIVSRSLHEASLIALLYDPELTTYSAAAHLLANAVQGRDTGSTLRLGAFLADIVLNLTSPMFQRIRPPPELVGSAARTRGFKYRCNRGFAFASLCYWFRHLTDNMGAESTPNNLLGICGLPKLEAIYPSAERYIGKRTNRLRNTQLACIRSALQRAGVELVAQRQRTRGIFTPASWAKLPSPQIMADGELDSFTVGAEVLTQADTEFLYDCNTRTETETRQALRAARGFEFRFTDFVY